MQLFPMNMPAAAVRGLRFVCLLLLAVGGLLIWPATGYAKQGAPSASNPRQQVQEAQQDCTQVVDPRMPLGLQVYGLTGQESPLFGLIQESGASWLRVHIEWFSIEPENTDPANFKWWQANRAIAAAKDGCLNIVATLEGTADWAATSGRRSPIQEQYLPEYAQFVQAIVERYDGDGVDDAPGSPVVHLWEFYNEPDFYTADDMRYGWGPSGAQYAQMLKTVYPAVKAANPQAQVVFGGVAYEWFSDEGGLFSRSFLDDAFAAGAGDYFDVMNIHCYPFPNNCMRWARGNSSGLVEKIQAVRDKMAQYGFSKPIILTETGWHSSSNHDGFASNDDIQGRRLVQLLTQALAYDMKVIIWWTLKNPQSPDPAAPGYPYDSGLVTYDPTPEKKPAFTVYRTLVERVGRAKLLRVISPAWSDNNLEAYRFRDSTTNKVFYVAWLNPIETQQSHPLVVPAWRVTVYDKHNVEQGVIHDADDGVRDARVTIPVSGDPLYIVVE